MKALLKKYPVITEIPIAWGDMDAFQHVNNVMYFKYFESARISYLEKIDIMNYMHETSIGPILKSTQCTFKIPLTYPDKVAVGARVKNVAEDRFVMEYAAISQNYNKLAATGEGLIVTFDYQNNTKTPIPDLIRSRIMTLENTIE